MSKLTKTCINKLAAPANKAAPHWDTEVKGFGLRATPTGKITYIIQGRENGSSHRIRIGPHRVFTVESARPGLQRVPLAPVVVETVAQA